jgi:hypothetical protein
MTLNSLLLEDVVLIEYEQRTQAGERMAELIRSAKQNCTKSANFHDGGKTNRSFLSSLMNKLFGSGEKRLREAQECC